MYTNNRSNNRKIAIAVAIATIALVGIVLLLLFLVNGNGVSIEDINARVTEIESKMDKEDSLSDAEKAEVQVMLEALQLTAADGEGIDAKAIMDLLEKLDARITALESRKSTTVSGGTTYVESSFDATSIWAAIEELRDASPKAYDDTAVWQAINELREELSVSQYDDSAVMQLIADLQAQINDLQSQINYWHSHQNNPTPSTPAPTSNPTPSEPENPGQGGGNDNPVVPEEPTGYQGGETPENPSLPEEPTGYQGETQPSDPVVEVEEPEGYQGGDTTGEVIDLRTGSNSTNVEEPTDVVEGNVSDPDIVIGEPDNVYQGN